MRAAVEDGAAVGTQQVRETGGLAALFAEPAAERCPEPFATAVGLEDPRPLVERRLMTDVLLVAAGELRDPVAALVLVVADDRALQPRAPRSAAGRP
jgi:hypothetical protein